MKKDSIQWRQVLMAIVFVTSVSIISTGVPLIYKHFGLIAKNDTPTVEPSVEVLEVTKQGIEEQVNKDTSNDLLNQTANLKKIDLLFEPIETPTFVRNPDRLRTYLEQKNVAIVIEGQIEKAFLYLRTRKIDIRTESIYFFIVDGHSKQGHLVSSGSLIAGSGTDFLFDLSQLPLSKLPFPLEANETKVNVVSEFLNQDISYKKDRKYYVGGFVSTTQLPNALEIMQFRYQCKSGTACLIKVVPK